MNGYYVTYSKLGAQISVYVPTEREAKNMVILALNDADIQNIGVRPA